MTPTPEDEEKMERLIHRTLRDLPMRRAPDSLPHRVLAEIERRAALPWWRKSFAHWPLAARAGFVLLSAVFVKLALMINEWLRLSVDPAHYKEAVAQQFGWMESGLAVVHAITGFFEIMSRNIPTLWLYGGLAFFALMYFTLFGLGAAAYKALHARN